MAKSKVIHKANTDEESAKEAVRTLIRWAGDDPDRPGMHDTPERVLEFYRAFFTGYTRGPSDYKGGVANDIAYDDFILVKDIRIMSFCEHHMLPATGTAHIAYIPGKTVPGLGTIARIAADCAAKFTTQESITDDILHTVHSSFTPDGIAVLVELSHGCMTLRGGEKQHSKALTAKFSGLFLENEALRRQFLMLTNKECDKSA